MSALVREKETGEMLGNKAKPHLRCRQVLQVEGTVHGVSIVDCSGCVAAYISSRQSSRWEYRHGRLLIDPFLHRASTGMNYPEGVLFWSFGVCCRM